MMSDVKWEMEILSCRQDLLANEWQRTCFSPPQSPIIERCRELQLRAANLPLLCLLGKARIIEILKVMTT